jgi:hypothetical protein
MYNMEITLFGFKMSLELLILIGVVYLILVGHTIGGCCNMPLLMEGLSTMTADDKKEDKPEDKIDELSTNISKKEAFTGANINFGQSAEYSLGDYSIPDTSKWGQPNLTVTPGKPVPEAVTKFLAREEQPIPLPEGEMLMFANTKFAPEFCPNTYSNSSGCAAMTKNQSVYLQNRGGNNVPYSEY